MPPPCGYLFDFDIGSEYENGIGYGDIFVIGYLFVLVLAPPVYHALLVDSQCMMCPTGECSDVANGIALCEYGVIGCFEYSVVFLAPPCDYLASTYLG